MFPYQTTIKMRDTDAAQVVFFANYAILAHEAYEHAFQHYDKPLSYWLHTNTKIPIIHSQAHYKSPFFIGDPVSILLYVDHIGTRSFRLHYEFYKEHFTPQLKSKPIVAVQTVHVTVENKSSVALPTSLIDVLHNIKDHNPGEYTPQLKNVFSQ